MQNFWAPSTARNIDRCMKQQHFSIKRYVLKKITLHCLAISDYVLFSVTNLEIADHTNVVTRPILIKRTLSIPSCHQCTCIEYENSDHWSIQMRTSTQNWHWWPRWRARTLCQDEGTSKNTIMTFHGPLFSSQEVTQKFMGAAWQHWTVSPKSNVGIIIIHKEGYSDHCGSGTVALATIAVN